MGLAAPDDASVYQLNEEQAVVLTVDFFAPLLDDPYSFGAVAAANAMSDIYAMGAEVVLALNVAAFPEDLPVETVAEVLRGGADKVAEAGGVIAGGHTIIDAEPKYGLCVLGLVHPQRVFTKAGARPGNLLYLSKPLGTGIITTAAKSDQARPEHLRGAIESMSRLNRHPSHIARALPVHALTDVTGYSILGHSYEMAAASGVGIRIHALSVPLLEGALAYAGRGISTGGEARNRSYLDDKVRFEGGVSDDLKSVLFDPQTSGGLLFAAAEADAIEIERRFAADKLPVWRVGEVVSGAGVSVVP